MELLERIKKFFGIGLTKEEKIARAKRKYKGWELVSKLMEIENPPDDEARYYLLIDLCAEYQIDFVIPCSGPG